MATLIVLPRAQLSALIDVYYTVSVVLIIANALPANRLELSMGPGLLNSSPTPN